MEFPARRKWLALSLMAVVIPISLLVASRLIGILPEPPELETIILEAVNWQIERPSTTMSFVGMIVENNYNDALSNVGMYSHVTDYAENSELFGDCLFFRVDAAAQVQKSFIHSLLIRSSLTDDNAFLNIREKDTSWIDLQNLEITNSVGEATHTHESYVYAVGLNQPKTCHLNIGLTWHFFDQDNLDHWTVVTLETTYFNGTAYQKVITPIRIGVVRDAGNNIDNPNVRLVEPGTYKAFVGVGIPSLGFDDEDDYCKVWVEKGHVINVTMKPANNTDFDLYLYDPTQEEMTCSENRGDDLETVHHVATLEGYWYIRVKAVSGDAIYTLRIEMSQP